MASAAPHMYTDGLSESLPRPWAASIKRCFESCYNQTHYNSWIKLRYDHRKAQCAGKKKNETPMKDGDVTQLACGERSAKHPSENHMQAHFVLQLNALMMQSRTGGVFLCFSCRFFDNLWIRITEQQRFQLRRICSFLRHWCWRTCTRSFNLHYWGKKK